jgi:hypothetical protein
MRRNKRRNKLLSVLLFLVIAMIVFNRNALYHQVKSFIGFGSLQLYEVKTVELSYDLDEGVVPRLALVGLNPVAIIDSKITLYSDSGEAKWQIGSELDDVIFAGNDNFFAVADQIKGNVVAYDYRGEVTASLFGEGEIEDLLVSEEGYIIIRKKGNKLVEIYDPKLNHIGSLKVNSGEIVKMKMAEINSTLFVATLSIEEENINGYLYKFDTDGNLIGSIQFPNELILDFHVEGNMFVVVTDHDIRTYSLEMEELEVVNSLGDIDLIAYEDAIVVNQTYDNKSEINEENTDFDIIAFDLSKNEVVYNHQLESQYNELLFFKEYLLGYNNNELVIFDEKGECVETFDLTREVISIKSIDNHYLLMMGLDYFSVFELKH